MNANYIYNKTNTANNDKWINIKYFKLMYEIYSYLGEFRIMYRRLCWGAQNEASA